MRHFDTRTVRYGRRLVGELWLYRDNSMLLELSTTCAPSEAFQVVAETRAFLTGHGIDLFGAQETKSSKALESFSEQLQATDQLDKTPARHTRFEPKPGH